MDIAIKRRMSFRKGYLRYTFEADDNTLLSDVQQVCEILSKGLFVVEVFVSDSLNHLTFRNLEFMQKTKTLGCYVLDQVSFLSKISISELRHMCIYGVSQKDAENFDKHRLESISSFSICLENYGDFAELSIRKADYAESAIAQL